MCAVRRGRRRSKFSLSEADAVLDRDLASSCSAIRRHLKSCWTKYPVGNHNPSRKRVPIACLSPAVGTAGFDHDEASGVPCTDSSGQAREGYWRWHRGCRPATHFIEDAAITSACGNRRVAHGLGRTRRLRSSRRSSASREDGSKNYESAQPPHLLTVSRSPPCREPGRNGAGCPLTPVSSSGHRNGFGERLRWCHPAEP